MVNRNGNYPVSVQPGIPNLPETPKGWKKQPLGKHLIEIKRSVDMTNDEQYQLVTVKRSRGGVEEREKLFGRGIKVKSQFYVKTGDFLISKRQIVHGACGIVPDTLDGAVVSGEYAVLGTNGGISLAYLKYLSESVHFQQTCFQSSIGVHVEKMVFKIDRWLKWDFNIPPLPEQQKIASILTTVDDKISSIENQIQQTEQLKKGLMEKLLTEGIGHTEFKDTKIGRIPKGWDVVDLGKITNKMTNGFVGSATPHYTEDFDGITYIQGYNVKQNSFNFHGIKKVTPSFHKKQAKSELKEGDLVTIQTGAIGTTAIIPIELEGSNCHALIITRYEQEIAFSLYVSYYINSEKGQRQIKTIETGTTMKHVNVKDFKKYPIALPTLPEQKQIASILATVDNKIDTLNQKKYQFQTLKKGLSQKLLTGQMRVKV